MIRMPRLGAFRHLYAVSVALALLLVASLAQAQSISLALYPWVPRYDQFVNAIQTRWQQAHPDVPLTIVPIADWDGGYGTDPTSDMDVFVFDATFLNQFKAAGYLSPLSPAEVANANDFLSYAIDGMQDGGNYYAIPLLGCTDVLFYWDNDPTVDAANSLSALWQALNSCTYTSDVPPDRRGLMVKGKAGDNNYRYVELYYSQYGRLPASAAPIDSQAVANGRIMLALGSYLNANYESDDSYIYSDWFSRSYGRTMVGYTESMSAMTPAMRANVKFKPMLFSDQSNRPLFFADVIGINSKTQVRPLAVELANLLASTDNVVASVEAANGQPPQYLMPTRPSVFQQMSSDPLYVAIGNMAQTSNPVLYALDGNARAWLAAIKAPVNQDMWASYRCGCDQDAGVVADYAQAQQVCPGICLAHGGWNGQWTNAIPGHQSVCGCNVCPTP